MCLGSVSAPGTGVEVIFPRGGARREQPENKILSGAEGAEDFGDFLPKVQSKPIFGAEGADFLVFSPLKCMSLSIWRRRRRFF